MSEREAVSLIFLPGFSTAEKVTNVSGRGVGMDVVKTNIEKIGGTVDVQSSSARDDAQDQDSADPGHHSRAGRHQRRRALCHPSSQPAGTGAARRRASRKASSDSRRAGLSAAGRLLPLVFLEPRNLKVDEAPAASEQPINIVVLQADDRQFGLVVDEINDTEEIVVKPLGKQLKGISVFAGATIMGDGASR